MQSDHRYVVVDDYVELSPPVDTARPADTGRQSRVDVAPTHGAEEAQLLRVESRLIALVRGDHALERDVLRWIEESRARFATARVRQFVPVLVEREVRARLRAEEPPVPGHRPA